MSSSTFLLVLVSLVFKFIDLIWTLFSYNDGLLLLGNRVQRLYNHLDLDFVEERSDVVGRRWCSACGGIGFGPTPKRDECHQPPQLGEGLWSWPYSNFGIIQNRSREIAPLLDWTIMSLDGGERVVVLTLTLEIESRLVWMSTEINVRSWQLTSHTLLLCQSLTFW